MTTEERNAMTQEYVAGSSLRQCAAKYGCARSTVLNALDKIHIVRRAAGRGNSVQTKRIPRYTGFDPLVVQQLWTGQCDWRGDALAIARKNVLGVS